MLALQISIIVILSGLLSTVTCAQQFLVLCTAGLEPFKPASRTHNFCKAFSWGDRGEYSSWSCPKVYQKRASGSDCWTMPDHPKEQPAPVGKVTCRDTYTFWTDKDNTINGIACRDTQNRRVKCNNMDQAASIDKCDPL